MALQRWFPDSPAWIWSAAFIAVVFMLNILSVRLYGEADDPEDMLEADEWYPKDLIGLEARLAEDNMLGLEPGVVVWYLSRALAVTGALERFESGRSKILHQEFDNDD